MKDDIIKFTREKEYRFISEIGRGATGRTILMADDTINEQFVCKKYSPINPEDIKTYFENFKTEIKILYKLYNQNIVRIFGYHLYDENHKGYIIMEYIKGSKITDYIKKNPNNIRSIFSQTISAFKHLEDNKILHRDIRPENILVSDEGIVKIIDFGFGKKIEFSENNN